MNNTAGLSLLVVVLLACLGLDWSRSLLRDSEAPPAPVVSASGTRVLLGRGWSDPGVHQFSDGRTVGSVISMTERPLTPAWNGDPCLGVSLRDGQALEVLIQEGEIEEIFLFWMPAGQRVAMGIPLHPDRMSREDWEYLPGVGPAIARRIEKDRQKNGEFGTLQALERVKGVGPARIRAWKTFFE